MGKNLDKLGKIGENWGKIGKNCSKLVKFGKNWGKLGKIGMWEVAIMLIYKNE